MIVNSFQIDEALQLKPLSLEELSEAAHDRRCKDLD